MALSRGLTLTSGQLYAQLSRRAVCSASICSALTTTAQLRSRPGRPRCVPLSGQVQTPRQFSSLPRLLKSTDSSSSASPDTQYVIEYQYKDILSLTDSPNPKRILIDVREPSELKASGRIPGALNAPLNSSPDFPFVPSEEFEDRFGFPRPGDDDEVIFYCKSGVRSSAAARLAQQAGFGGKVAEYRGSWKDWEAQGGPAEKGE